MDDTLEEEVGMECTNKYGAVNGVVIFEVTEPGFPPELAVRIFVSFERQEAAIKVKCGFVNNLTRCSDVRGRRLAQVDPCLHS